MGDPCLLEEDLSAPYPECCPRMKCPNFDDVPDELNEIDDDQLMMADEQNPMVMSYDATLDQVCTYNARNLHRPGQKCLILKLRSAFLPT